MSVLFPETFHVWGGLPVVFAFEYFRFTFLSTEYCCCKKVWSPTDFWFLSCKCSFYFSIFLVLTQISQVSLICATCIKLFFFLYIYIYFLICLNMSFCKEVSTVCLFVPIPLLPFYCGSEFAAQICRLLSHHLLLSFPLVFQVLLIELKLFYVFI